MYTNSADPDQTPHSAASDLDLHCLPVLLGFRPTRGSITLVNDNHVDILAFVYFG